MSADALRPVRVRDIPGCARTLALAYAQGQRARGARVRTAATTPVYASMLWILPEHYHRDRTLVVGVRRQGLRGVSGRAVGRWATLAAAVLGLSLIPPWWVGLVVGAGALLLSGTAMSMERARRRTLGDLSSAAPKATWTVSSLAARPGTRVRGATDAVAALVGQLAAPGDTVAAVARHPALARLYAAHGFEPLAKGDPRMIARRGVTPSPRSAPPTKAPDVPAAPEVRERRPAGPATRPAPQPAGGERPAVDRSQARPRTARSPQHERHRVEPERGGDRER